MGWLLVRSLLLPVVVVAMACSIVGAKIFQKMLEGPYREGLWPCLEKWEIVRLRTSSSYWNVPGKYGPYSELFFLIKKEPVALAKVVPFKPVVPAETLKAGALAGLHGSSSTCGVFFAGAGSDSRAQWSKGPLCGKTMCLARQVRLPFG